MTLSITAFFDMTLYNDIQHSNTQHNDIQHSNTQHNAIQHNDIQYNNKKIQHSAKIFNGNA